jgi:biopolymer transport protein TolR
MQMNLRPNRRKMMAEINVVPYIDVMLVLLIIFMVTAPVLTQGVLVDLPQASSEPIDGDQDDPFIVTVQADGAIYVNVGLSSPDDTGARVDASELSERARRVIAARPDVPVYVRADHQLGYGDVIGVMTLLQQAGAISVGLITEPPGSG